MLCFLNEQEEKVFYYQFDQNDYLQKMYYYDNGVEEYLFNRGSAIEEAKENYYKDANNDYVAG